jgi:hypothetical protein
METLLADNTGNWSCWCNLQIIIQLQECGGCSICGIAGKKEINGSGGQQYELMLEQQKSDDLKRINGEQQYMSIADGRVCAKSVEAAVYVSIADGRVCASVEAAVYVV